MNFKVSRYPESKNWAGCIEPDDRSWIMFVDRDNRPTVYLNRDETGGVMPDDPSDRPRPTADA
jgi:hypothetical protein